MKIKIYQQNTKFNDTLEKTRVLVCVFLLAVLSLLSISFLFSDVNAIEVKADFNGDGKDDLAIGVPSEASDDSFQLLTSMVMGKMMLLLAYRMKMLEQ